MKHFKNPYYCAQTIVFNLSLKKMCNISMIDYFQLNVVRSDDYSQYYRHPMFMTCLPCVHKVSTMCPQSVHTVVTVYQQRVHKVSAGVAVSSDVEVGQVR